MRVLRIISIAVPIVLAILGLGGIPDDITQWHEWLTQAGVTERVVKIITPEGLRWTLVIAAVIIALSHIVGPGLWRQLFLKKNQPQDNSKSADQPHLNIK